jgi:hypothetical protein
MSNFSGRGLLVGILFTLLFPVIPLKASSPFCSDSDCTATRQFFEQLCDYVVQNRSDVIYTGGYYMRTLVAGYEILGDRRYLDTAIAYGDTLLKKQMTNGYWATGYGGVALADTGSALGVFAVLYKHVDRERQKQYVDAVERYVESIPKDGMILPNGALGDGWDHAEHGKLSDPDHGEYTISSALTGGETYTWMYHMTKDDKYRRVAYNALRWVFSAMRKDGVIPYVSPSEGASLEKQGDTANDFHLWDEGRYMTSTYLGEGLISFDLHCDQPEWKAELRREIKPHIEWLLRTQNPDGSWGKLQPPEKTWCSGKMDMTRSPGVANLLIWYYENVHQDPRIVKAVQEFDRFLLNPQHAKAFGLLNAGATLDSECSNSNTVTSLTGRATADILAPGITSKW